MNRRNVLLIGAGLISVPAWALDPVFTGRFSNVGVSGYDPVAYFTQEQAIEGSKDFELEHEGVRYRFSTDDHLQQFAADPDQFLPAYGGYCAYAVANGYTAKTDPEAWTVVDGRLYLNFNRSVRDRWLTDVSGNIAAGDKNWPGLLN